MATMCAVAYCTRNVTTPLVKWRIRDWAIGGGGGCLGGGGQFRQTCFDMVTVVTGRRMKEMRYRFSWVTATGCLCIWWHENRNRQDWEFFVGARCTQGVFVVNSLVYVREGYWLFLNFKISSTPGFFLFSCTLYFICTCFFICILPFVLILHHTQHKHPCLRRDKNPQPQQAIGRRP